ncbi:MAG TPA: hypothetical protein VMT88_09120 [Actinomycetes bacterium]|nr:hypothetical protein [Actinomycetes bacterium]
MSRTLGLVSALIDDAAVFPPGNAPLKEAVQAHYGYRDSRYEELVGPLLVPASGVESLRELVDPNQYLSLGVIGDTGLEGLIAARNAVQDDAWIEVNQFELRLSDSADVVGRLRQLLQSLPFTAPTYIELSPTSDIEAAMAALAEDGVERAKFRCGPDTVPSSEQLARFIHAAATHSVPFKLTAGLHHALPYNDASTRVRQHGFINTLAATWEALIGGERTAVAELLDSDDAQLLLNVLADADVGRLRSVYRSFGSCSIAEPYEELLHLGLIDEEA